MLHALARLILTGLRGRPLQAVLTALLVAAAATTLTVALSVGRIADNPWQRTFEATNGAHVIVTADSPDVELGRLAQLPGVSASTGALPVVFSSFPHAGGTFGIAIAGTPQDMQVSRPAIRSGHWLRPGTIVLESSFARRLGVHPGERLSIRSTRGAQSFLVAGTAVTASRQTYPEENPGLAFLLPADLARVQPHPKSHFIGVRLDDPDATAAFVRRARPLLRSAHPVFIDDWRMLRDEAATHTHDNEKVVRTQSVFLLFAVGFILATLIGGRVVGRTREIGLLKAVGMTPRQVVSLHLAEELTLGLAGAIVGIAAGTLITPLFVHKATDLLGGVPTPSFDPLRSLIVLAAIEAVVAAAAFAPSRRGSRLSVAEALEGGSHPRVGRSRLARLAERLRLPVPVVVGVKDSFARPGRALLTSFSLALTVALAVAAMSLETHWTTQIRQDRIEGAALVAAAPQGGALAAPQRDPGVDPTVDDRTRLRPLVYSFVAIMVVVGLLNLLTTTMLSVRERVRELGILKAVGLTPRQVVTSLVTSQATLGLVAAALGIPLGIATYRLVSGDPYVPPWWWLVVLVPVALAAVAAVCVLPARRAAGLPVPEAIRYE